MTAPIFDLHVHSSYSDGKYTPTELCQMAQAQGICAISITDHDSIDAYKEDLSSYQVLPGVEFSSIYKSYRIHILGYAFNPGNPAIHAVCKKVRECRERRNAAMIEKLRQHGFDLTDEELNEEAKGVLGRCHIATLMAKKKYVKTPPDAFKKYIGEGKSCYVAGDRVAIDEIIDVIHAAKGFAVLAHPHLIASKSIVDHVLAHEFDGLEGYYSSATIIENHAWVKLAEKKGLIITGGSDFHAEGVRPGVTLGCASAPEKTFMHLWQRFRENLSEGV